MVLLRILRLAASLVVALGLVAPLLMLAQAAGRSSLADRLQVALCRVILAGLGLAVAGDRPRTGPVLLVSNHVSWLDILVIGSVAPVGFLAKIEVADWPVIGGLARARGTVFVDRARRRSILPANTAMAARLAAGQSLVLFAEGTTSAGAVLPFRSSHLACLREMMDRGGTPCRAAVQGVSIRFSDPVAAWIGDESLLEHLPRVLATRPLRCTLRLAPPRIVTPGFDRKALGRALHADVTALLADAAWTAGDRERAGSAAPRPSFGGRGL